MYMLGGGSNNGLLSVLARYQQHLHQNNISQGRIVSLERSVHVHRIGPMRSSSPDVY